MLRRNLLGSGIAALVAFGVVGASAAGLGPVSGGIFAATGPVTYTQAERSVADVELITSGQPPVVESATVTIQGSNLADLPGQDVTLVLFDAEGDQAVTVTETIVSGDNLSIDGTTASVWVDVSGAPARAELTAWAVFVAGAQVLGPTVDSQARVVTIGDGEFEALPTTWEEQVVEDPDPGTEIVTVEPDPGHTSSQQSCLFVTVRGIDSTPRPWSFTVDYSAGPFFGNRPTQIQKGVIASENGTLLRIVGTSTGSPHWSEWNNNALLTDQLSVTVNICDYQMTLPPAPEAYTVSAVTNGAWTTQRACRSVTVTGNGSYPFYFGYEVTIDMAPAFQHLQQFKPSGPDAFEYQPDILTPSFSRSVTQYALRNQPWSALEGTESRVLTLCAINY